MSLVVSVLYLLFIGFCSYNMVDSAVTETYNMVLAYGIIWYFGNMIFGGLLASFAAQRATNLQNALLKALTSKQK